MRYILVPAWIAFAAAVPGIAPAMAGDTAPTNSAFNAYIEAYGGSENGWSTHYDPSAGATDTWSDSMLGGSARLGLAINPNWSFQGDVWSVAPSGASEVDWGVGGHFTWHSADSALTLGVLGSLGAGGFNAGQSGNVGLEGAVNAGRWRLYGQAGATGGLSGDAGASGVRDLYATLSANYFFTPNFFVSANIGTDNWTQSNGDSSPEISWGGKIEFKPSTSPVSVYAAYEGYGFRSNYNGQSYYDQGIDNIFFVGARIPLGKGSLRDTEQSVGLADLNPLFGDIINR